MAAAVMLLHTSAYQYPLDCSKKLLQPSSQSKNGSANSQKLAPASAAAAAATVGGAAAAAITFESVADADVMPLNQEQQMQQQAAATTADQPVMLNRVAMPLQQGMTAALQPLLQHLLATHTTQACCRLTALGNSSSPLLQQQEQVC